MGEAPLGGGQLAIELRALNHRYQEVRVRLPQEFFDQSFFLEQLARVQLGRGRYDVSVRVIGPATPPPRVSAERARALHRSLTELRDELAPGSELPFSALLALPNVVEHPTVETQALQQALTEAFGAASAQLEAMRREEGQSLTRELLGRLESARRLRQRLADGADLLVEQQRTRLRERLARLLQGVEATLDPSRVEAELAILADKSDITEELVRLQSHFDQLAALFTSEGSVGRKLDFLLQEVGREVNTIGSKCQSAEVTHLVVELKAEVERMREQVQNVE
jgi:uncharacterized protein (TIGR00255 family)